MTQIGFIALFFIFISCSTTSKNIATSSKNSRSIASINERFLSNVEKEYAIGKLDFNPLPFEYRHFVSCVKDNKDGTYKVRFGYENLEELPFKVEQGGDNKLAPVFHVSKDYPITEFKTGHIENAFELDNVSNESEVVWKLGRSIATANSSFLKKCD